MWGKIKSLFIKQIKCTNCRCCNIKFNDSIKQTGVVYLGSGFCVRCASDILKVIK